MKKILILTLLSLVTAAQAVVVTFDLSPAGTDNAVGLSPLNETSPVINSTGSGNEIGSGIRFNTDTLTLSLSLGYGSAFGFSNLTSVANAAHIHGPAPTNTPAGVVINLAGLHVLATNPAAGGSIVGDVVLTSDQATALLAGLYYINIHTPTNQPGEIRGQLIPVNVLPTLTCPASTNALCAGTNGTFITLAAQVADTDADPLTVVWSVNGAAVQTNAVASSTNTTEVTFSAVYDVGTNFVTVSVSDGPDGPVTCTTTVVIVDATPPVILSASITPSVLWPPNHKMKNVQVSVAATDNCDAIPTCRITSIQSSQAVLAKGSGKTSPDSQITGALTANVRAERSGKDKAGRTYTVVIECADSSGNAASTNLTVHVPHDQRNHSNNGNGANAPGQNKPPKNKKK